MNFMGAALHGRFSRNMFSRCDGQALSDSLAECALPFPGHGCGLVNHWLFVLPFRLFFIAVPLEDTRDLRLAQESPSRTLAMALMAWSNLNIRPKGGIILESRLIRFQTCVENSLVHFLAKTALCIPRPTARRLSDLPHFIGLGLAQHHGCDPVPTTSNPKRILCIDQAQTL